MPKFGEIRIDEDAPRMTKEDLKEFVNTLPRYTSLAAATTAGLQSGDLFVLTGAIIGISTVHLIAVKP